MKPLSLPSRQVLEHIAAGRGTHHRCYGQSAHGGRSTILYALVRRGLIDSSYKITDAGQAAIAAWNKRKETANVLRPNDGP